MDCTVERTLCNKYSVSLWVSSTSYTATETPSKPNMERSASLSCTHFCQLFYVFKIKCVLQDVIKQRWRFYHWAVKQYDCHVLKLDATDCNPKADWTHGWRNVDTHTHNQLRLDVVWMMLRGNPRALCNILTRFMVDLYDQSVCIFNFSSLLLPNTI